jgi:phosphate transport system substrate-binding protein
MGRGLYNTLISLVIIPLFILFFVGYLRAKKFVNKVSFTAYFAIFALLIYTLFCFNLAFVLSGWNYSDDYFLAITILSNITFLIANGEFIFEGEPSYAFLLQIVSYGAFGAGFALALWKKGLLKFDKKVKILTIILLVLSILCAAQWLFRNSRFLPSSVAKLEKFQDGSHYGYYRYNEKDYTITPIGDPTLKFSLDDNLPKLNGATALCPIFYSVREAMYPQMENSYKYINCSTTPYAYEKLIEGSVDLIFVLSPSSEQLQKAKEKGVEFILTPIGKEAFVFLTNKQNPIKNLSVEQIRQIYTGKITNWRELGGEDEKILAFQRNENSGSQSAMEKYVMKGLEFQDPIREEFPTMGGMIEGVANYRNAKNAIGYSFRYYATVMNPNIDINLLSIENINPSVQNIKNNTYPFTAEFYIVARKGDISPNVQKLIDWFLSEQGQTLIKDVGYVPIKDERESQ